VKVEILYKKTKVKAVMEIRVKRILYRRRRVKRREDNFFYNNFNEKPRAM